MDKLRGREGTAASMAQLSQRSQQAKFVYLWPLLLIVNSAAPEEIRQRGKRNNAKGALNSSLRLFVVTSFKRMRENDRDWVGQRGDVILFNTSLSDTE
jgi:hypothetical protein